MKKLLLLLAAGSIAMNVGAQEHKAISGRELQVPGDNQISVSAVHTDSYIKRFMGAATPVGAGASKTTTFTGGRWYNYGIYMGLYADYETSEGRTLFVDNTALPIWNDTNVIVGYSSGPAHLNMVSVGNILHPQFVGFNRSDLYGTGSLMQIKSEAYKVDSIVVPGFYFGGSNSTVGTVDTIRIVIVYGNGNAQSTGTNLFAEGTTGGHYGTISFLDMAYDSVVNTAVSNDGSVAIGGSYDIWVSAAAGDTSNSTSFARAIPVSVNVPGNNYVGASITYKSGEVKPIIHSLPGDTVIGAVAPFTRYTIFRPNVLYYTNDDPASVTNTTPSWAPFATNDRNEGIFKNLPNYKNGWEDIYIPMWAWSSSTGASALQYPEVGFHIDCPTCNPSVTEVKEVAATTKVNAVPNPANNMVNINFSLAAASDVNVTLTNALGQIVATQNMSNTIVGKATFNTSALAAGVYMYAVEANGTRTTGRVVIAR